MKKISIYLTVIFCLSFLLDSAVYSLPISDYTNPFTGNAYEENDFYDNGIIFVILNHDYSIEWREYTSADFPELELVGVKTHPALSTNQDDIIGNPEYRNFVYLTLSDKSDEAMINAISLLYERNNADIYFASPASDTFYIGDEWDFGDEPIPLTGTSGVIDEIGVSIVLSKDSGFTDIYSDASEISAGSTVYYRIVCMNGYFCNNLQINAETIDRNSFIMPENLSASVDVYCFGDTDKSDTVSLKDISFVLKYLAHYPEICHIVFGSACGEKYLDFNNDGKVNLIDCSAMLKYIAKWEGVGPVASEYEEDFVIKHIDSDVAIFEYFTKHSSLTLDSDGRRILGKYNQSIIESTYDWNLFLEETVGTGDMFSEIGENGVISSSKISAATIKEKFDDSFFADNDLIPLIIHSEYTVGIDKVWRSGSNITLELVIGENINPDNDPSFNEYNFLFVAVPKNSTDSRNIKIMETDTFPKRFEVGFDF